MPPAAPEPPHEDGVQVALELCEERPVEDALHTLQLEADLGLEDMLEGVLDVVVPAKLEESRGDVEGLRFRFSPKLGLVQVEDILLTLHALVYL